MSKQSLTTGKFTYAGTEYGVTAFNYSETYAEIETTDTSTQGDGKEFIGGRAERAFDVTLYMNSTAADLVMNTASACNIDFEGKTYSGSASLLSKAVDASIDTAVTNNYTGKFIGAVTVTPES